MNNMPFKMLWKESTWEEAKTVYVYDFVHDITDTFLSMALCWVPSTKTWVTVPVGVLTPIITITKKKLNEVIT